MTKKYIIVLVACGLLFGGIFGFKWFVAGKISDYLDNMPQPTAVVTTSEVTEEQWVDSLQAVGTVKAVNGIAVTSQVAGIVTHLNFRSGDEVKQGELLVRLDDQEDRANLKALQSVAKLAALDYSRTEQLYRKGSVSKSQLDEVASKRDEASAQAVAQGARLAYKNIIAPFDGKLGIRQVDLGEYVSPGAPLVMLQSLSPIYVNFSLSERDLPKVAVGLPVSATLDSAPGETFSGEIVAVDPGVDPDTRNVNIQAVFENKAQHMLPGMFAAVEVELPERHQYLVIPRTAIKFNPYGDSVYVVERHIDDDDKEQTTVVNRFIKLGQERGDIVVVRDGLKAGDEVVTSGLLKLRNNAPVEIDNSEPPPADPNPQPDNS